jgi:hypothetical protein
MKSKAVAILVGLFLLGGCSSTYYSIWKKLGYEKRDLLVSAVEDAKTDQEKAKEQFKTTMQRFKELTNFNGGELESKYNSLNSEYESCESRAKAVSKQITDVDEIANDMFKEWKGELSEYQNADLRRKSQQQLDQSQQKYADLLAAMRKAESSMQPVLQAFHDQVLFLKHNLNAQAIASLQTTASGINDNVQQLIKDMENSINQANDFINHMKS